MRNIIIPEDLQQFYRANAGGFVCPCCKYIYKSEYAGVPWSFRAHIKDYLQGGGCFFAPKTQQKHAAQEQGWR